MSAMSQNALVYAGVLFASGATFLLGGLFFIEAWRHRRTDREYLLFGLATLALGIYAAGAGGVYCAAGLAAWSNVGWLTDVVFASAAPAASLLLDFAMRYARLRRPRVAAVSHTVAAVGVVGAASGTWRGPIDEPLVAVEIFGAHIPAVQVDMTWFGMSLSAAQILMVAGSCALLLRAMQNPRTQLESRALVGGSVVLLVSAVHDATALGVGLFESVSLLPLGFIVFVYGVALTVVLRYGRLSEQLVARRSELRQRSDEVAESLAELQRAQEHLVHSEQLAVVGEFAAVITHEVRNPMTIVNTAVANLRRVDLVTDDTGSLLGIIEQEMLRLERLVTHLLNYARPVVPQRQAVELEGMLEKVLGDLLDPYPDVEHGVSCEGAWPTLYVDRDLMEQALENIVANAVQAMDGRGDLKVRVARRRVDGVRSVIIGFEDTGEGMTEHQLEQAMSPFYTTRPAGTGLGLAICERIVDAHGGMLVLSSERGVGTAVSVILPEKPDERLRETRRAVSVPPRVREA